jgi:hypothetical protein
MDGMRARAVHRDVKKMQDVGLPLVRNTPYPPPENLKSARGSQLFSLNFGGRQTSLCGHPLFADWQKLAFERVQRRLRCIINGLFRGLCRSVSGARRLISSFLSVLGSLVLLPCKGAVSLMRTRLHTMESVL